MFEPSFIPVGVADAEKTERPDFGPHASFNFSRWAVDGGVVVNLPLTEALDRVYERSAVGEVSRVVLYVNPTPAVETPDQADPVSPMPGLRQSVATIVTAPRAEGISGDLDDIDRHNRQIDRQSQTRVALGALGSTVSLSGPGYLEYCTRRANTSVEHLLARAFADCPTLVVGDALTQDLVASRVSLFPKVSDRLGPAGDRRISGAPLGLGLESTSACWSCSSCSSAPACSSPVPTTGSAPDCSPTPDPSVESPRRRTAEPDHGPPSLGSHRQYRRTTEPGHGPPSLEAVEPTVPPNSRVPSRAGVGL